MVALAVWLEADYFKDFQCKCGSCRHSCCKGWQIDVSERDYFRLIGMDCSPELHHRIECAFACPEQPTEDCFRMIVPNWLGQCPMQDGDGLCALQKECGAEALPKVCNFYPRSMKQVGNVRFACCSGSCEAAVELILSKEQLHSVSYETEDEPLLSLNERPGFPGLCIRCIEKIRDRSMPLEERIASITAMLGGGECPGSAEIRNALAAMEEISPEIAEYIGEEQPGDERALENLLANHFLYTTFPFTDDRLDPKGSVYGLVTLYSLLKMVSGCSGDRFIDAVAAVFHLAEHTSFYFNAFVLLHGRKGEQ